MCKENEIDTAQRLLSVFPRSSPPIKIEPCSDPVGPIRCLELQWWFAIPRLRDRTLSARYNLETGMLDCLTEVSALEPAQIHGIDCIKMQVNEAWAGRAWRRETIYFYCRIGAQHSEWLAVESGDGEESGLFTFQNKWFAENWGGTGDQRLIDDGRFQQQPDGSLHTSDKKGLGAGTYQVTIGDRSFRCLRVLDPGPVPNEHHELSEAFIAKNGRTVLYRQHRGRLMRYNREQDPLERHPDERFPLNQRIVIDGAVYVQSNCLGKAHDIITHTGLGLDPFSV